MTPRTVIEGALLGLLGGVLIVWWHPGGCVPPPAALPPRIEAVVRARNGMAADASLTLIKDTRLQGSCVRRLMFADGDQGRFGILLSPDHRWA